MSIIVQCPGCGGKYRAPVEAAGKRVKCPKCSTVMAILVPERQQTFQAASNQGTGSQPRSSHYQPIEPAVPVPEAVSEPKVSAQKRQLANNNGFAHVEQVSTQARRVEIMPAQPKTGVEIKLGFFPLAFFLVFCTPRVEIDGAVQKKYWGTHFFPTRPGKHRVKVYFRYFFMSQCGANSIDIAVTSGNVTTVKYFMPPWMFAKGSLMVLPP